MSVDYAAIIRQVGRGREGARAIARADAAALFGDLLDGRVPAAQLGALLMAYRIKGESRDELAGFLDALHARVAPLPFAGAAATVVIPTYNGARTMPNLVPLLGLALARRGVPVLMHGVTTDPGRVASAAILAALGVPAARDANAAATALATRNFAFMPIDALAPGLAALLAMRRVLGVRNSAHTVAKMFAPVERALLLASVTHPEYLDAMRDYYSVHPSNVLLMRGTQGEAVANARRAQTIEWLHGGRAETLVEGESGTLVTLPDLPAIDAHETAAWTRAVLDGDAAMPAPIARQIEVIERIARRVSRHGERAA